MIAYRHADPRFPFLREDSSQSAGRWNTPGELTHYFCDTPNGAWAEFLRHEEIRDPRDIPTIRRALWAVDIGEIPSHRPDLPRQTLIGGPDTWPACQQAAQQYREHTDGIAVPSAALEPGAACGWRVDGGLKPGPDRDGQVFALFGRRPDLIGWVATVDGRPSPDCSRRSGISDRMSPTIDPDAVNRYLGDTSIPPGATATDTGSSRASACFNARSNATAN